MVAAMPSSQAVEQSLAHHCLGPLCVLDGKAGALMGDGEADEKDAGRACPPSRARRSSWAWINLGIGEDLNSSVTPNGTSWSCPRGLWAQPLCAEPRASAACSRGAHASLRRLVAPRVTSRFCPQPTEPRLPLLPARLKPIIALRSGHVEPVELTTAVPTPVCLCFAPEVGAAPRGTMQLLCGQPKVQLGPQAPSLAQAPTA